MSTEDQGKGKPVESANLFCVGGMGDQLVIVRPPMGKLTKAQALNLAAWLVCMATEGETSEFEPYLEAVLST